MSSRSHPEKPRDFPKGVLAKTSTGEATLVRGRVFTVLYRWGGSSFWVVRSQEPGERHSNETH